MATRASTTVYTLEEEFTMTEKIREQILAIRDSGETNMFDTHMVQYITNPRLITGRGFSKEAQHA